MEGNYKKWINRINSKQDVLTEDNVGSFMDLELPTKLTPTSGDTVLARDILTNKAVEIPIESLGGGGSGLELGETSSTAYRGDRGKIAYDHSQTTGNPHGTTKNDIGLGNVDNTSDLNKPISTATQTALNNKLDKGTYTGNASDLQDALDLKLEVGDIIGESPISVFEGGVGNNLQIHISKAGAATHGYLNASDWNIFNNKLDKGTYTGTASDLLLNDQNLENSKQKKVTVIPITGNTTLSEIHNGAILHITNSCTLTFAANLGKDFNFVEKAFGSIIVQHVAASGVTLNSDSGLILKNGAMGSVYAPSNDNFILTGTYTTS